MTDELAEKLRVLELRVKNLEPYKRRVAALEEQLKEAKERIAFLEVAKRSRDRWESEQNERGG